MDADTAFYLAIGLIPLALLFFWLCRRSAHRLNTILETPTIACRDLPGLGASTVEVCGIAQSPQPMLSDLTATACVAFTASITEHWTTTETVRDSKGNTRTVTRHHSAVRYSNSLQIPFEVVDDSGSAHVEPEGAEIELVAVNAGPAPPGSPAHGVSAMHWNGRLSYDESVLPIQQPLYVLAAVSERHSLVKPHTLEEPFIISPRTEKQLVSSARWGKRIFGFFAIAILLTACGMLGYWLDQSGGRFPWQIRESGYPIGGPAEREQ